jgi:choline dehydrogenase
MLSGIGRAPDLERLSITVRANLPGVGQNLHDHLAATATYEATRPVPPGRNQNSEAGLYCKSDPGAPHYDLQFAFLHIPFLAPGFTCGPHGFTVFGGAPAMMIGWRVADMVRAPVARSEVLRIPLGGQGLFPRAATT